MSQRDKLRLVKPLVIAVPGHGGTLGTPDHHYPGAAAFSSATRRSLEGSKARPTGNWTPVKAVGPTKVFFIFVLLVSQVLHWREATNDQIALRRVTSFACRGNKGL